MTHRSIHDGADLAQEYTYDQCGRLLSDANRGIASIVWNVNDRPQSIILDNGTHIDYAYSASGEKLREQFVEKKKVPGFTWMMSTAAALSPPTGGGLIIAPRDSITIDHVTEERMWINGFELVGDSVARVNVARGYWAGGAFHRYALDWQGNVGAVIAQNGAVEQRTLYYPYGAPYRSDSPEANPYKFSGKQLELRQGLNMAFHGSRLYFADLGRFASPDIFSDRFHWLSPWSYCAANPLNLTDPSGNKWEKLEDRTTLEKAISSAIEAHDETIKSSNDSEEIANATQCIELLNKALHVINLIETDSHTFYLSESDKNQGSSAYLIDGKVAIQGNDLGLYIHEIIHIGQLLESEKGLCFVGPNDPHKRPEGVIEYAGSNDVVNLEYELLAYRTQFAFNPEHMPQGYGISKITDITLSFLSKLNYPGAKDIMESIKLGLKYSPKYNKQYEWML